MLTDDQKRVVMQITVKLAQLGHDVTFVEPVTTGPLITTYRFIPRQAAKVSQIAGLTQDIALALAVEDVTIRRIPGEAAIGVSVPNATRTIPMWRDRLSPPSGGRLSTLLGVDAEGKSVYEDITALPHLLIAGSTGGGKTVLLRSLLASMCYWYPVHRMRLVISDTKQVEFGVFDGDPHLWRPRAVTTMQTLEHMDALIEETERRLKMLAERGLQNVGQWNDVSPTLPMSYIVLFIDELADFMGKSADKGIAKLSEAKLQLIVQRSRASGIHVIAATQRPSVDVVTGTIKSNFPARLTFRLPSEADSRTILGHSGAEHLLALGDCYYVSPLAPASRRLHSCYATNDDITQCIKFAQLNQQGDTHESHISRRGNLPRQVQ